MKRKSLAFTLVEMLTVIAITAVLLTIIVLPIFQSFNLTRAAEAFSNAQDLARSLTSKISKEIGSAVSVRGSSGTVATVLNGTATKVPANALIVQVLSQNGTRTDVVLPNIKIDIIPAAQVGAGGNGVFVDPISGKIDPTLKAFKGQVQTPVAPSGLLTRYGVGLRDPFTLYNDPYSGILMAKGAGRDNLFTLFRSVAAPYVYEVDPNTNVLTKTVNTALFGVDGLGNIIYDDPRFLVPDRDNSGNVIQNTHNLRIYHWLGQQPAWESSVDSGTTLANVAEHDVKNDAHTVIQTEVSRYDMIMPQYDLASRKPAYDIVNGVGVPRLTSLIQFRPTVVANDPAAGQEALRPGEETDNAVAISPDVYKTQYGLWNNAIIRTYPSSYANGNPYSVGYVTLNGAAPGFSIYAYDPAVGGTEFTGGTEYFDTFSYDNALAVVQGGAPVYPFSVAVTQANVRSGWLTNATAVQKFTPYHFLSGTGKIVASFDISEVGLSPNPLPTVNGQNPTRPNLPTLNVLNTPLTPTSDPTTTTAVWSGMNLNYDPNTAFDAAWNSHPYLQPNIQRFIDLRVTPNEDGTYSPLYPLAVSGQPTGFLQNLSDGSTLDRCRIVPGTEVVVGPDENPGDHYGHPIRYSRVTLNPGPNQYRINYVDQREPNSAVGNQVTPLAYENALGLTASDVSGFVVNTYDPTNFVSATIQARYKGGYVQLDSDPNTPVPQGYFVGGNLVPVPFKIDYRFQFAGSTPSYSLAAGAPNADSFAVDYDTRQLMQVLLTIRNYPQSDLPNPQTVTLKATATLKNFAR